MKKLYVGCAISGLLPAHQKSFLAIVEDIKNSLRDHFEVLEFLGTNIGSPEEVYIRDIVDGVGKADCMLAICNGPSTGLGYEIAAAVMARGIPVLAMAHRHAHVSRLIEGINAKHFYFIRYDSVDEIPHIVVEVMSALNLVE